MRQGTDNTGMRYLLARWLLTVRRRWTTGMPRFFRGLLTACAFVGGTALAINTAITAGGGVTHEWWNDIYPYLIGIPAGAAFASKFTAKDRHDIPGFEDEKKEP